MQQQQLDPQKVREFAGQLFSFYRGGILSYMVKVGYRTGLFEAAAQGPATSEELAERAGLTERYVREWLGSLTSSGIFDYDPATRTYTLPPERANSSSAECSKRPASSTSRCSTRPGRRTRSTWRAAASGQSSGLSPQSTADG